MDEQRTQRFSVPRSFRASRRFVMAEAQKVPQRAEVPVEHTWDLAIVYANADVWDQDVALLESMLPNITALEGTLSKGALALLQALTLRDEITKLLYQLYIYASHRKDSDSTD